MTKRPEGQVIILSESDAEALVSRLSDLAELVWETLERRRVVLRAPHGSRNAKVIPLRHPAAVDRAPLDELF
jgi:hypothetical protein